VRSKSQNKSGSNKTAQKLYNIKEAVEDEEYALIDESFNNSEISRTPLSLQNTAKKPKKNLTTVG
jgi:hypothetical protein